MYGVGELAADLRNSCGLQAGDVVIVHSSMKSIGQVDGGPRRVVEALQSVLTEQGTLLMPTFAQPEHDGRFYLAQTPSRTGLITETFRTMPGVRRSRNPTHSAAGWGRRLDLLDGHERTSALGADSPFHKAAKAGAKVLMIGCTMNRCSLIHVAEAITRVPYLGKVFFPGRDRSLTLIDETGAEQVFEPRDIPACSNAFTRVQDVMDQRGLIRHARLGAAQCLVFSGAQALDTALEMLRRDPAALLCDRDACPVCPAARRIVKCSQ